jgi:hypothetical protein
MVCIRYRRTLAMEGNGNPIKWTQHYYEDERGRVKQIKKLVFIFAVFII